MTILIAAIHKTFPAIRKKCRYFQHSIDFPGDDLPLYLSSRRPRTWSTAGCMVIGHERRFDSSGEWNDVTSQRTWLVLANHLSESPRRSERLHRFQIFNWRNSASKAWKNIDVSGNLTDPNFKPPILKMLWQLRRRKFFTSCGLVLSKICRKSRRKGSKKFSTCRP